MNQAERVAARDALRFRAQARLPVSRGTSASMTSAISHAAAPVISAGRP